MDMSSSNGIRRYVLVPRTDAAGPNDAGVRRYSLARLGTPARSALGEDRHERLERAAGMRTVKPPQAPPTRRLPDSDSDPAENGSGRLTNGSRPRANGFAPLNRKQPTGPAPAP